MRRQDMSTLLAYHIGYSALRNRWFRLKRTTVTRILAFHEISGDNLRRFEKNLRFLARKTNVICLDDFFAGLLSSRKINIIITFDDGYQNWVGNALPILKRYGMPATFFITSGFVGLSLNESVEFNRAKLHRPSAAEREIESLAVEGLKRIVADGFTVGGHTRNHIDLGACRDQKEIREEIIEDKIYLEGIAGVPVKYFAYPRGIYNNPEADILSIVKEAGYKGAVTTMPGFNTMKTDPYHLHREITRAGMPYQVFKARAYGNQDLVVHIKKKIFGFSRGN